MLQVNWRATRLRTWAHDLIVIPNSVATKSILTNHSRPKGPHRCIIHLKVDLAVAPGRVIHALATAATGSPDMSHGTVPQAYACAFSDSTVEYELAFAIDSFALMFDARSAMLVRIAHAFRELDIAVGAPPMDVRIVQGGTPAAATGVSAIPH